MTERILAAVVLVPMALGALFLVAVAMTAKRRPPVAYADMDLAQLREARARCDDPAYALGKDPEAVRRRIAHIDHHIANRLKHAERDAAAAGLPKRILSPSELGEVFPSSAWLPFRPAPDTERGR